MNELAVYSFWFLTVLFLGVVTLGKDGLESYGSDLQTILMTNWNENVKAGSQAHYNGQTATWDFTFQLRIPRLAEDVLQIASKTTKTPVVLFRVELETRPAFGDFSTPSAMADQYLLERIQYTDSYRQGRDDILVNATLQFDHSYSGNYQIRIYSCTEWNVCPQLIYDYDLGLVVTPLHELDVHNMKMTFDLTSHDQGALVEFEIDYGNTTDRFLGFAEFIVELVDVNSNLNRFKARSRWTRIDFRNCSDELSDEENVTNRTNEENFSCIHNLPIGNYTVAVIPIDSRCNVRDVNVYLEPIPATRSSKTRICERTSDQILEILNEHFHEDESFIETDESHHHLERVLIWTFSGILVLLVVVAVVIYVKYCRHSWPFHSRLGSLRDLTETGLLLLKSGKVLLIYDPEGSALLRARAAALRQQLLAVGVYQVYDYCEEQQTHEGNYWFTARLHDPTVRIAIILSAGLKKYLDLLDQLSTVALADRSSLQRRIHIITYQDIELAEDDGDHLAHFARYYLPGHFDQLVSHLMQREPTKLS